MVGIVLISHGGMAEGIMSSAAMLYPELTNVSALTLWEATNPDDFQEELSAKIKEADTGDGVFVLADIMGGTPCNRAMYLVGEKVRLLTGLSLTMLISLLCAREETTDMAELSRTVLAEAIGATLDVNELLKKRG